MKIFSSATLGLALFFAGVPAALPASHESPAPAAPAAASGAFVSRTTSNNRIALAVTNYGSLGTNFVSFPSLGFPAGAGFEHLTHAGLWIGAHALDGAGAFTGVTTGALDMSLGGPLYTGSEFTPAGTEIRERSSHPGSPFFDVQAVSEQDFVCVFDDLTPKTTSFNPEMHRPLGVSVRQEIYSWSDLAFRDVLFLRYVIRNAGPPLRDAWVGLYSEFASGKLPYGPGWFSRKLVTYDAPLRLFREHYCNGQPVPAGCNFAYAPWWAGLELLGVRPGSLADPGDKQVTVAAWAFSPGDPARDQDIERYAIMSAGTVQNLATPDLLPGTGDPVELLAVGPFASIASGDSIEVDFALVGGSDDADIQQHAQSAQLIYDSGYTLPVTPVLLSLIGAQAEPGGVELGWHSPAGAAFVGTVERREAGSAWAALGEVSADGTGRVRFVDPDVRPGGRYGYRIAVRGAGSVSYLGEVWVDVPLAAAFGLRGSRPNPAREGDLVVSFSLDRSGPATLELLDVRGRRVLFRALGSLGPGDRSVNLAPGAGIPPGTYIVRLSQEGRSATRKVVLLR